jgi:hypothetical protein
MRWIVALALTIPFAASAYVRTTTKSSSPPCPGDARALFWNRTTVPFAIDAAGSRDLSGEAQFEAVRKSFQTWADVPCSYIGFEDLGVQPGVQAEFVSSGPNVSAITWIERDWPRDPDAIAVTLTTFRCASGEILDADILLNGVDFRFTTDPFRQEGSDVQNTVTHEVGHLLGFDHDPDPASTMFASSPRGEISKRFLAPTDIEGLCAVYRLGHEPGRHAGGCGCDVAGGAGGLAAAVVLAAVLARGRAVRRRARRGRVIPAID